MPKLTHYIKCTSQIELLTGMSIGGAKEEIKIGGMDNPVIKNPITNMPYIPGSSLKGRFRMALELKYNDVDDADKNKGVGPSQNPKNESMVVKLFGSGKPSNNIEPTRFLFRDSNLTEGFEDYANTEEKIEVKMDREKLAAFKGGNRPQERVAAGAKFDFEVMVRVFEGDDEEKFKERLNEAKKIVELEYLGGSGSRGYGQVKISDFGFQKIEI